MTFSKYGINLSQPLPSVLQKQQHMSHCQPAQVPWKHAYWKNFTRTAGMMDLATLHISNRNARMSARSREYTVRAGATARSRIRVSTTALSVAASGSSSSSGKIARPSNASTLTTNDCQVPQPLRPQELLQSKAGRQRTALAPSPLAGTPAS